MLQYKIDRQAKIKIMNDTYKYDLDIKELVSEFAKDNLSDNQYLNFQGLYWKDQLSFLCKTVGYQNVHRRIQVSAINLGCELY